MIQKQISKNIIAFGVVGVLVLVVVVVAALSQPKPVPPENIAQTPTVEITGTPMETLPGATDMPDTTTKPMPGEYIIYDSSKLTDQTNILFFWASWCPTCKVLNDSINANLKDIPPGVTIFRTNYDTEIALRQKYKLTYQHTLVQVDKQGNMIKKWSNSPTLNDLLSEIKR